jgi:hypothetical protein
MRKTIITLAVLAFAATSLPALAAGHDRKHQPQFPSITDLVTDYAVQISTASPLLITVALKVVAAPATTFDAAGWTTKIEAAVGTPTFIQTVVDAVNAAIAARQAAAGPGFVTVTQDFINAARAANPATR